MTTRGILWLRQGLRLLAYGLLVLATLEVAARVDDWLADGASPWSAYTINNVFEPSPLGRVGRPGAHFRKWSMNSLGFRGPEPVAGRINVVTYGASETFGLYESPGREYARQLEGLLNQAEPGRYNVVNIGIPGLRIGHTDYLAHALGELQPRFVVVYPSPANYIGTTHGFCGEASRPVPNERGLADRVRLVGKIEPLVKRYAPAMLMDALRAWSVHRQSRDLVVAQAVPEATVDAFRDDLRCVVDVVRRSGAVPVLVTHATWFAGQPEALARPMLTAWRKAYPDLAEGGFLDLERRANRALSALAAQEAVPLVDAAHLIPGGSGDFADYVHFTDAGAARMAAAIAPVILQRPAQPAVASE